VTTLSDIESCLIKVRDLEHGLFIITRDFPVRSSLHSNHERSLERAREALREALKPTSAQDMRAGR
jgi:hypothetical protein